MKEIPIFSLAEKLGIDEQFVEPYGRDKAKISLTALKNPPKRGKLILVSAITPTPAGEGKTTTSIGLAQGFKKIGKSAALALRQPSMGPVFGRKGGATGGGKSTVQPATEINLQFTGDFHAITSAHNLLADAIDNRLYFRNTRLDSRRVTWKRVLDMNDRALRSVIVGCGGNGVPRETGFDITVASEIMAILCLAQSYEDLRARLNKMVVGFDAENKPVFAEEIGVTGSLMAILKEALKPNLVQSVEGVPAFIHGGPFANIAQGCNSVIATQMAMSYADYAITEAGFAFDLGGEKFFDIKCRTAGFAPDAVVIVATIRALKMHGGRGLKELTEADVPAVERGLENLAAHIDSAKKFKRPIVVAINRFPTDTEEEFAAVKNFCAGQSVACAVANVFGEGGDGATELAQVVADACETPSPEFVPIYPLDVPVEEKLNAIAREIYGADGVTIAAKAKKKLELLEHAGASRLMICMAKTQNSISDDPAKLGRPRNFTISVRDFEIAAGAGFLVALTGDIMRMPALPKVPCAESIDLDADGNITGMLGV
ncbi:MAG: formate--tetrahydrofolate ligase [Opitutales bacterium]|nr:formate--tetrahydrofolate ligase [Opitutales bacterium]